MVCIEDGMKVYDGGEGVEYFRCQLPVCKNGDQILENEYYLLHGRDQVKVTSMKLVENAAGYIWHINADLIEYDDSINNVPVGEFLERIDF
jgi:hypothetical protein